jgi:hypothetical protein
VTAKATARVRAKVTAKAIPKAIAKVKITIIIFPKVVNNNFKKLFSEQWLLMKLTILKVLEDFKEPSKLKEDGNY